MFVCIFLSCLNTMVIACDIFITTPSVLFLYSPNIVENKRPGNLLKHLSTISLLYPCFAVVALYK
jgi:hypothetical protein